eukprot:scaffold50588_cov39-Phaeocystis_antarctica.AAC.1
MPSFRAYASSPRKRIASSEKPPQTSLMSTSTSCPPSSISRSLPSLSPHSYQGSNLCTPIHLQLSHYRNRGQSPPRTY